MPGKLLLPYPHRKARIDLMSTPTAFSDEFYAKYYTKLGCFSHETHVAGDLMEYPIPGIEQAASDHSNIGHLVRAEFFWKHEPAGKPSPRGVVLFDNRGAAIIHVVNALLGYGGSGPALSKRILDALGVPSELFEQANQAVESQDYVIVFSREQHGELFGVDSTISYAEPAKWEWWRVR
jgi:hypothetical protein